MTDKELIKQEIERLLKENEHHQHNDYIQESLDKASKYRVLYELKKFIDSLPEEPASEDLEEVAKRYATEGDEISGLYTVDEEVEAFKAGAEWQKQQDYKMYAHIPLKDIQDAWLELKKNKPDIENYPAVCFQKGADWRENHMKELFRTEYEKGRFDMREELLKDAVGANVKYQIGSEIIPQCDRYYQVLSEQVHIDNVKIGDKVKIIIVKPEQQ